MKTSQILFFSVLSVSVFAPPAFSDEVWAPGVSLSGGWFDFNKFSEGAPQNSSDSRMNDDSGLCWAATASNVIAWWQVQNGVTSVYSEMGRTIPQGKDVYQTFVGVFENVGGNPTPAFQWWVDGSAVPGTRTGYGDEGGPAWTGIDGKTYYPDFYYSGGLLTNANYTPEPLYSFSGNPATIANTNANNAGYSLAAQNKAIVEALESGYALSVEVANNGQAVGGHAITLWGVEYQTSQNGDITFTKAYITDSDDSYTGIVEALVTVKGETAYLSGMKIENLAYNITNVHGLRTIAVPEPSSMLPGLLLLAGVVVRRHRISR